MESIIFGVVALVVLLIGFSAIRAFGNADTRAGVDAFLQSLHNGVPGTIQLARNLWDQLYDRVIYPVARRMTWAAEAIIVLAALSAAWVLLGSADGAIWALAVLGCGAFFFILLLQNDLRTTGGRPRLLNNAGRRGLDRFLRRLWNRFRLAVGRNYSAWNALGYACIGLAVLGAAIFAGGQATHSVGISVLGAVLIVIAIEIVFATARFVARLATLGVDIAEGSSNFFVRIITRLASHGKNGALEAVREGINIADQERFIPAVMAAKARVIAAVYPVLLVGSLRPDHKTVGVTVAVSFATGLTLVFLAAVGHDVLRRRLRSALWVEKIGQALMVMMVLHAFFPKVWGAIEDLAASLEAELLAGGMSLALLPWYAAVVGGIGAIVLFLIIMPGAASRVRMLRWLLAAPFALIAFWCASSLVFRAVTWGNADTVALNRDKIFSVSKTPAPKVVAHDGNARLTWQEIPKATGYRVERRSVNQTDYTLIADLAQGTATHYDDVTAKSDQTYAYRIVARFPGGAIEPSQEMLVTVPHKLALPGSSSSASAAFPGPAAELKALRQRKAPVRLASSGDMEPGADRYCSRHPNAPSCQDSDDDP